MEAFQVGTADISLSHLLELTRRLRIYKEGIVLVGGWVPYLLLLKFQREGTDFEHVGSKDIDLALNPEIVDEEKYATIREMIKERGFKPKKDRLSLLLKRSSPRKERKT